MMGKGRTWCISFEDAAKKDGDVTLMYQVIDESTGAIRPLQGKWEGYKKGDPPDKKAQRFFDKLVGPYKDLVEVKRAGNTICFQLRDGAPYRDIVGVKPGDETGQNFDIYDDPPVEGTDSQSQPQLEVVRLGIAGTPKSPNGQLRLGLGHVETMARVATMCDGRPEDPQKLLSTLAEAFNTIYEPLGFKAQVADEEVVVPNVPCKLGCRGGCSDEGITYWLSMADAEAPPFPRFFDKPQLLIDAIRTIEARLDLAGIPRVMPWNAGQTLFSPVPADGSLLEDGEPSPQCTVSLSILSAQTTGGSVPSGRRTVPVKIRYTAFINGKPLSGARFNVAAEKFDGAGQYVVSRLTSVAAATPATDSVKVIDVDTNLGLTLRDVLRITVSLVSEECQAVIDGPLLLQVGP